jgi:hypothetical protein
MLKRGDSKGALTYEEFVWCEATTQCWVEQAYKLKARF